MEFKQFFENSNGLDALLQSLFQQYPGIKLDAWENDNRIELSTIEVPQKMRGNGIGSNILKSLKDYAQKVNKPIVLRPQADRGKIAALDRFYDRNEFVKNKGRNADYTLSSPFAATRYWKPR
jgi:GNAT superfamily N-acetyltransferase